MSGVLVDFPFEEAEGLRKLLLTGAGSLTPEEMSAAFKGKERLERAISIERNPTGNAPAEAAATGAAA